ncbi:phage portal protein [Brucella sp. 6810]|uniref:phage portal protein n=1 Tax=Brucella sp. 6810 TaxID=2769351 RepID=UPI00165CBF40|nr:phage portal protein [Brucella sp. 6810]QNQ62228.1 phage portal protein [Brucella sp. 6810]
MTLLGRFKAAAAAFGATQSVSDSGGWLVRHVAPKTKAGVSVNEYGAMYLPIVYACVNRISNPMAMFPLRMYRPGKKGNAELVPTSDHPLAGLINVRPNPGMASRTLRKTVQAHALLWGNGYLEIERNRGGQATGLYPLLPDRTRPVRQDGRHFFRTTIDGRQFEIDQDDVIHIMDQSHDGYVGLSQIAHARQSVGWGLAMEEFGSKFFANDAKSGGFLMHPGKLSPTAKDNVRGGKKAGEASPSSPAADLERQGGLDNAHRVKVLEEGMKWIQTTIPPEDAQFLGSREFQIADICRIYDVPLILVQSHEKSTAWGTGIEQLMIGFVRQTIAPWCGAWEQELNWKLFTPQEREQGYYVKFNMNAFLRGDSAARAAFYKDMFGVGAFSPNMILELEEEDSIGPAGDHHFVPANFTTLENAVKPASKESGVVVDQTGGDDE